MSAAALGAARSGVRAAGCAQGCTGPGPPSLSRRRRVNWERHGNGLKQNLRGKTCGPVRVSPFGHQKQSSATFQRPRGDTHQAFQYSIRICVGREEERAGGKKKSGETEQLNVVHNKVSLIWLPLPTAQQIFTALALVEFGQRIVALHLMLHYK